MSLRRQIAKWLAPDMYTADAVKQVVKDEVKLARMGLPATASYDPHNEGYRRMSGNQPLRDLAHMEQSRMFEIAYYMWDSSLMTAGMAKMDKAFLFAEPITITSNDENVTEVLERFWEDPDNGLKIGFPDLMMWLSLLGEQCWPVLVDSNNGHVTLGYTDPAEIKDVMVLPFHTGRAVRVDLVDGGGSRGRKMQVIRMDKNGRSSTYGKLVGECFFFPINNPPNSARGRSDFLTLFDWIDGLERYGYNYLERAEFLLNFVWDVTLNGYTEQEIKDWLRDNPPPQPGSQRAHNENVTWQAVSPDLNAGDVDKGFNMGKAFIMGGARRPASWFGEGGKAYQTEADQFGQVPIKDLDDRQRYCKEIATQLCQFQVDQAVIHRRLTEKQAEAGFTVNFPEISKKDFSKLINGVPQAATALTIAEEKGWIGHDTAARIFAMVVSQMGMDIDVEAELKKAKSTGPVITGLGDGTEDYNEVPVNLQNETGDIGDVSLNGAQIASLLKLVQNVADETLPRESALNIIITAFPITKQQAEAILGSAGKGFKIVRKDGE